MRSRSGAVLAALVLGSVAFTPPAYATPVGRVCAFTSVTDPTVENGQTQMGQVNGGPVTDDTQAGATITLTCTIQVGAANNTHAGTDSVALSNTGTGAASVAGQASYVSPEGQPVYLCTEVTVNGTTYYRDSVAATWSSSNTAPCGEAISQDMFKPGGMCTDPFDRDCTYWRDGWLDFCSVWAMGICLTQAIDDIVDPVICPILATLFPPEGDIPPVRDCPPYGP